GIIDGLEQEWGEVDAQTVAPRQEGPPPVPTTPEDTLVFATMHVPAFDRPRFPLAEGVSLEQVLDVKGAGHYPDTALPGETADAFYVYETTESLIVQPEGVEVIAPTPGRPGVEPTERMLTLTACHPMYSARERIIVHAEFSYWTKRSDGIPEALAQDAGTEES